jgi:two-component system, OmpR family, sensor histidine kinase BaeS
MRRSFAFRLAAAFAGVGILAAALTALLVNFAFGNRFTSYLEQQQQARQQQLVTALSESYQRMGGWNTADLQSLETLAIMDGGTFRLVDPSGQTVWTASEQMAAMHRQMMGSGALGPAEQLPVVVGGTTVGIAIVREPSPGLLPQDLSFRSAVNRLLLLGGILAGAIALMLGVVLARRATAPAREMTRAARDLAAGDRSRRVEFEAPDELGEMAVAFNAMADTIEEEDRLRRMFAADVAHELRTPLTILRTQVEGLQDGVVEPSSKELASLHDETLRLTRLVADLETLASADAAGFSQERQPIDLRPVLERAAREFAGAFEAEDVELSVNLENVRVDADATRIHQVVSNLLSNALKFTPAGGVTRVALRSEDGGAVIQVSDSGSGIPADELPYVFERFFRGKGSRARGSGIGLTVARELVRAHGGDIQVDSAPDRGTAFTVRLPGASSGEREVFTTPSQRPATVGAEEGGKT